MAKLLVNRDVEVAPVSTVILEKISEGRSLEETVPQGNYFSLVSRLPTYLLTHLKK